MMIATDLSRDVYALFPASSRQAPVRCPRTDAAHHCCMPGVSQPDEEIRSILGGLKGREVAMLQVLGVNSLKSVTPSPDALVGEVVNDAALCDDRTFCVTTSSYSCMFDLQRAGTVVQITNAEPHPVVAGGLQPTVRLLLVDRGGFDLVEPVKTKRITVTLRRRSQ